MSNYTQPYHQPRRSPPVKFRYRSSARHSRALMRKSVCVRLRAPRERGWKVLLTVRRVSADETVVVQRAERGQGAAKLERGSEDRGGGRIVRTEGKTWRFSLGTALVGVVDDDAPARYGRLQACRASRWYPCAWPELIRSAPG